MNTKYRIVLNVNGIEREAHVEPRKTLADVLREDLGLTGTHIGCEHGVCGACTISADGKPMRACLMFAIQAQELVLRTVEGLANGDRLHPLQQAFLECHGLQCGFCTPGFLMLASCALEQDPSLDRHSLEHLLSSNLCRCTGYANIKRAVQAASKVMQLA